MVARTETFRGGLDDVRAFCAVVDLGTVTAAALPADTARLMPTPVEHA